MESPSNPNVHVKATRSRIGRRSLSTVLNSGPILSATSKPDYINAREGVKLKLSCFWCRHLIPEDLASISCPLKYAPIYSKYSVKGDKKYISTIDPTEPGCFHSDGLFCSFNCCLAYALDNKHLAEFAHSRWLVNKMYIDYILSTNPSFTLEDVKTLKPAPSWRLLESYGGSMSIAEYRASFNTIYYNDLKLQLDIPCIHAARVSYKRAMFI